MLNPFSLPNTLSGFSIFEVEAMVVYDGEDWSKVRSPARARRRRRKHPQNITAKYKPDGKFLIDQRKRAIYCHPVMANMLRAKATEGSADA